MPVRWILAPAPSAGRARPEPQRKAIKDDKDDPPCIRAKREYLAIVRGVGGQFICLGEGDRRSL